MTDKDREQGRKRSGSVSSSSVHRGGRGGLGGPFGDGGEFVMDNQRPTSSFASLEGAEEGREGETETHYPSLPQRISNTGCVDELLDLVAELPSEAFDVIAATAVLTRLVRLMELSSPASSETVLGLGGMETEGGKDNEERRSSGEDRMSLRRRLASDDRFRLHLKLLCDKLESWERVSSQGLALSVWALARLEIVYPDLLRLAVRRVDEGWSETGGLDERGGGGEDRDAYFRSDVHILSDEQGRRAPPPLPLSSLDISHLAWGFTVFIRRPSSSFFFAEGRRGEGERDGKRKVLVGLQKEMSKFYGALLNAGSSRGLDGFAGLSSSHQAMLLWALSKQGLALRHKAHFLQLLRVASGSMERERGDAGSGKEKEKGRAKEWGEGQVKRKEGFGWWSDQSIAKALWAVARASDGRALDSVKVPLPLQEGCGECIRDVELLCFEVASRAPEFSSHALSLSIWSIASLLSSACSVCPKWMEREEKRRRGGGIGPMEVMRKLSRSFVNTLAAVAPEVEARAALSVSSSLPSLSPSPATGGSGDSAEEFSQGGGDSDRSEENRHAKSVSKLLLSPRCVAHLAWASAASLEAIGDGEVNQMGLAAAGGGQLLRAAVQRMLHAVAPVAILQIDAGKQDRQGVSNLAWAFSVFVECCCASRTEGRDFTVGPSSAAAVGGAYSVLDACERSIEEWTERSVDRGLKVDVQGRGGERFASSVAAMAGALGCVDTARSAHREFEKSVGRTKSLKGFGEGRKRKGGGVRLDLIWGLWRSMEGRAYSSVVSSKYTRATPEGGEALSSGERNEETIEKSRVHFGEEQSDSKGEGNCMGRGVWEWEAQRSPAKKKFGHEVESLWETPDLLVVYKPPGWLVNPFRMTEDASLNSDGEGLHGSSDLLLETEEWKGGRARGGAVSASGEGVGLEKREESFDSDSLSQRSSALRGRKGEGKGSPSIQNFLRANFPSDVSEDPRVAFGICHRLDKDTSGPLVVAKTYRGFHFMRLLFEARLVNKRYICLVHGHPDLPPDPVSTHAETRTLSESCPSPLRLSSRIRTVKDPFTLSLTSSVVDPSVGIGGKSAVTLVESVQKLRHRGSGEPYALCEVSILTGRTHQIRVHLTHAGYPLVGDPKYIGESLVEGGQRVRREWSWCPRLFLHCSELSFSDLEGGPVTVACPLPVDLQTVLDQQMISTYD
uniref:Pseudouridine synthase RsuA/RluA-like domain-containing protein n=1 Tax=Chromera velia CCMP2878 TaxID=1169474 RepID=A0A0G4IAK6_9ALVE|eukprot:Cvel_12580.t1-p1 / transcript=Cvel_12580.t1 / gene=Cvel_12580 / organism=Chromera_velia_CCMP2878 / gene_product=Uncharacterized RNA pseudouridine synthase, putative / transcript_product=Uncharacterized RNA pseudouridine synthase, putative / location=Cvel_scaffold828:56135-61281(+) / protein_length=1182 / sequence_SO=supercontig / SO=protein_coding / is_pseudo=false